MNHSIVKLEMARLRKTDSKHSFAIGNSSIQQELLIHLKVQMILDGEKGVLMLKFNVKDGDDLKLCVKSK